MCGILLERWVSIPQPASFLCAIVSALLCLLFYFKHQLGLSTLMICLSFAWMGITLAHLEKHNHPIDGVRRLYEDNLIASGDPVEITGVIEGEPEIAPDGFFIYMRVEKVRAGENARNSSGHIGLFAFTRDESVRASYDGLNLHYGARVVVMTELSRSESFRNPGGSLRAEYLEEHNLDATGSIKSSLLIERLNDEPVFLPLALLYEWRQRLLREINTRFSPETAGVLDASLLGNRNYLSHSEAEGFREGGTFHILVINGLHIGFIAWILWIVARRLTQRRLLQFFISESFLWSYVLSIGAAVSVMRAALLFTVVAFASVLFRKSRAVNALACAALVLLVARPGELFNPAFLLTIGSVLSIVTIALPVIGGLQEIGAWRIKRETPYPPRCARWLRTFGEALFWNEKEWKAEMEHAAYSYRLFKSNIASTLQRIHVQPFCRYAFQAVVVSISVQIGLLPLLVIYFHRISFAALLLNVYVGILMACLASVALIGVAISQASIIAAKPFLSIADKLSWLMVHSVDPFAAMHAASMRLPHYTGLWAAVYIVYYFFLAVLVILLAWWKPLAPTRSSSGRRWELLVPAVNGAAFSISLAFIMLHPYSFPHADGRLRVDHLDVGQGDSALLTMPDGTTLLVDGGGRLGFGQRKNSGEYVSEPRFERDGRSIGEAVVAEYLWWRGLDHVDYILATHADADHIDGLNYVAANFRTRGAIVARMPEKDTEYARFAETARNNGVPIMLVGRGDVLRFGEVSAEVLWPSHVENPDAPYRNNDSLVLRLRYGERSFILAGDIEKQAEGEIVVAQGDLAADVVKVGHHGSKTSSTDAFVSASHPHFAIVSVGLKSPFGHPSAEVVERWVNGGARVMTTGNSGTITISTDGKDLRVTTFVPQTE